MGQELTRDLVRQALERRRAGDSVRQIARDLGVPRTSLQRALSRAAEQAPPRPPPPVAADLDTTKAVRAHVRRELADAVARLARIIATLDQEIEATLASSEMKTARVRDLMWSRGVAQDKLTGARAEIEAIDALDEPEVEWEAVTSVPDAEPLDNVVDLRAASAS